MPTPLYDALRSAADAGPLRLDMPGHHGGPVPGLGERWPSNIDFTEHAATGDLFGSGGDAIQAAEELWAGRLGMDACLFLTGGSTQGIHTALALLAGAGGHAAVDRGCHRSVYNALALLDLTPHFLPRPWLAGEGIAGPVDPAAVERALKECREIKTVCITSPTYYGVLSDIPAIAAVCRRHGARLLVDGAHGAHLPFLGDDRCAAADAVVLSAHKTLPAPGQTALLLANGVPQDELRRVGSVYGSSSPSYVMMAALDAVRDYMDGEGAAAYRRTAARTADLRRRYPCVAPGPGLELDPTRLTLRCADGFGLARRLEEQGVWPEMADRGHVVCILTCADGEPALARLDRALSGLSPLGEPPACPPPPPLPTRVISPRGALFAPREQVPLEDSAGRVAGEQLAPYPPGVPVVAPGERIEKMHLVYLREIGYNKEVTQVLRESQEGLSAPGSQTH